MQTQNNSDYIILNLDKVDYVKELFINVLVDEEVLSQNVLILATQIIVNIGLRRPATANILKGLIANNLKQINNPQEIVIKAKKLVQTALECILQYSEVELKDLLTSLLQIIEIEDSKLQNININHEIIKKYSILDREFGATYLA